MVEFSKECMDANALRFFLSDMVIDFKGSIWVSAQDGRAIFIDFSASQKGVEIDGSFLDERVPFFNWSATDVVDSNNLVDQFSGFDQFIDTGEESAFDFSDGDTDSGGGVRFGQLGFFDLEGFGSEVESFTRVAIRDFVGFGEVREVIKFSDEESGSAFIV